MKRICFACLFLCLTTAFLMSQSNPVPLVNQPLVPSSAVPGSPGLTLTVNGAGFVSTSVVNWNGIALSTTFVSVDKVQGDVPPSDLVSAGTVSVTVSNPAPGGGTSNVVPFTVTTPTEAVAFASSLHAIGSPVANVLVADFNGDGKPDLAVFGSSAPTCSAESGAISILLGNGHGGFTTKSTICSYGNAPFSGVVGDFNHDGKADLAVISSANDVSCGGGGCAAIAIYLGNGDGTFTDRASYPRNGFDGFLFDIAAADLNGDGNLDLAVGYNALPVPNIFLLLGNGDGSFGGNWGDVCADGYLTSASVALGDFNNDGIIDIASVGSNGGFCGGNDLGSVSIFLGNGDGTFTLAPSQPDVTLVNPTSVMTADFTGDGILDLAIADPGSTTFTILKGNGDGTFTQVSGEPTVPENSTLLGMADFNGDGNLDLAFSAPSNIVTLFLGNGYGTFQAGLSTTVKNAQFGGGGVGDFNGDGRLDLAIANSSDTIAILRQTVAKPSVSITLASGQNPSYIGQPVAFTAVVSASPYSPTGSVTFKQGATVLGTTPLLNGQASFTTTFTRAGTFPVTASYSGDKSYPAKNSNAVKQIVNKYATTTALVSSPNPSVYGQTVTWTATVTSAGPNAPTGMVKFGANGSAPLSGGVATITKICWLNAGTNAVTAKYVGDAGSAPSTSSVLEQVVNPVSTTTAVTSSANPSSLGQSVTFTATVTSSTGAHATGTVTFTAGGATLGTVALSGIHASISTAALPEGATTITATYNGANDYAGSSGALTQTVD
ncbi:MAG: Ig-like domain repeat protein [Terriglobales bacterium]|jgi:hypothetical protein